MLFRIATVLANSHRAISRKDKMLIERYYVCKLNFEENDILSFDETILNDKRINKIKIIRTILKAGAVPCIFSNFLFYLIIVS